MLTLHTNGWLYIGPKFVYLFYISLLFYLIFYINIYYLPIVLKHDTNSICLIFNLNLAFIIPNIRAINRIGPHPEDIISVLVGSLLGDGHGERLSDGGVRFTFKQSDIHKNYFFWLYYFFNSRGYCNNNIPVIMIQHSKSKIYNYYYFRTYSFTSLLWLYNLFYNHNKNKIIPVTIANYLTPLALAVWIQDDGNWHGSGVRIATNCFLFTEINLLIKALENNFKLKCSIHKNRKSYQIYIKAESITLLRNLILPHFDESMYYKLGI
jgi:ubiquinol-cytochrome c reductase cytochrome b subunit